VYFRPFDKLLVIVMVVHAVRSPRLVRKLLRQRGG
jgi:hypothetical protein